MVVTQRSEKAASGMLQLPAETSGCGLQPVLPLLQRKHQNQHFSPILPKFFIGLPSHKHWLNSEREINSQQQLKVTVVTILA
jgi:hypothetical protein